MGRKRTLLEHGRHLDSRSTVKSLQAQLNTLQAQYFQNTAALLRPFIGAIEGMIEAADEYREDPAFVDAACLIKLAKEIK